MVIWKKKKQKKKHAEHAGQQRTANGEPGEANNAIGVKNAGFSLRGKMKEEMKRM